jgi:Predicted acyltransferases
MAETALAASGLRVAGGVARLDSLTGLRWWAAFAVFLYHVRLFAPIPFTGFVQWGNFGVTFFFVLSGFVLTWSARPTVSATTFWWRRFSRIYPSHFVALLLAIPVFYSFSPDPAQPWVKPVSVGILMLSVVLLQGWSNDPTILFSGNPAAWTLTCEAFFYALHPALHRGFVGLTKRAALLVTGGVILVAFAFRISVMVWPHSWMSALPLPVTRLSEFVVGIGIARAMLLGWRLHVRPIWCYLITAIAMAALTLAVMSKTSNPIVHFFLSTSNEWVIVLCAATIAAVAHRDIGGGFSLLRSRLLVTLGAWSYAFYLVHATVMYVLIEIFGRQKQGWIDVVWTASALVLALGVAAALHYLIERPCESALRSWWNRRLERRGAAAAMVR